MDLCRNCGYVLTPADLTCPECGTPVGGPPRGFGGSKGPSRKKKDTPSPVVKPPVVKPPGPVKKPDRSGEGKEEEPEIVKPWAVDVKKASGKKKKEDDLSDTFTITKTEVKRKMQLGASAFWRENLKYIILALAVVIVIYAVLAPYYRKERIQKDIETKEYEAMLKDEDLESKNVKLLLKRVDYFLEKKKFDKVLRDLTRAKDLAPNNPIIYHKLGRYYFKQKKDYDRAVVEYAKALKISPEEPEFIISRAIAYEARDDLPKSMYDFTHYIRLKPESADGYAGRGKVYRKQKKFDKAIEDLNKAVELEPEDIERKKDLADLYYQQAKMLDKLGKRKDAVENLKMTLKYDPRHEFAKEEMRTISYKKAVDLMNANKNQEALVAFDETIAIDGNMVQAYAKRGEVNARLKNLDKAIEDYQKAYDIAKKKKEIEKPLMDLYHQKLVMMEGSEDRAGTIRTLTGMIRINPRNATLILKRGKLQMKQGDMGAAAGDFRVVIKIDPSHKEARKLYSKVAAIDGMKILDNKDYDLAIKTFQEVLKYDPSNVDARVGLAEAYLERGKFDQTDMLVNQAIKADPKNARAYLVRGDLYKKRSLDDKAVADWKKAKELSKKESNIWNKATQKLEGN